MHPVMIYISHQHGTDILINRFSIPEQESLHDLRRQCVKVSVRGGSHIPPNCPHFTQRGGVGGFAITDQIIQVGGDIPVWGAITQ
jgi:hypothetical protein